MQLRNNYTFGTIDNKGTIIRHIRNRAKENVLYHRIEIFVIRISTVKFQFGLKGYTISESALKTFLDRITRFINIIVDKLQYKVIASISNREILSKNFVQTVILTQFTRSVELQKIFERL